MGKSKKSQTKKYKLALSDSKAVDVNKFRGKVYFHLWDKSREKNVSLNKSEFVKLAKNMSKIGKKLKKLAESSSHDFEDEEVEGMESGSNGGWTDSD